VGASVSSDSITITPRGIPDAPVFVSYLRTNVDIQISFRNGPSDGDSLITEYLYAYSSDDGTTYTDFTPIDILVNPTDPTILCMLIDGLDNGTAYKFKLKVANIYNQSPPSAVIDVAPVYPPGAPHLTSYVNGNTTVDVNFDASGDGGSPILNYAYSLSTDGGITFGPFVPLAIRDNVSPITITGLDNSLTYAVQLQAINDIGDSSPSNTLTGINPYNVPFAPTNLVAAAENGYVDITFDEGAIDPDTDYAVVNYQYSTNNGGVYAAFTPATTSSPVRISGLSNGTPYTIRLKAITNSPTRGEYITGQSESVSATPATVPNPPTALVATAGNESVSIAFTPPTNNGGSAILSYTATSDPEGITGTGTVSPITVAGLTNGTPYTFTIVANNAFGDSVPSSASDPATPAYALTRIVFTTGSDSWTAPAGVTSVDYLVVGGGGGGGGAYDTGSGGGGGGGLVLTGTISVTEGDTYLITIGAGGAGAVKPTYASGGGDNNNEDGSPGGVSSIGSLVVAGGGGGGYKSRTPTHGAGGAQASGLTPPTGGNGNGSAGGGAKGGGGGGGNDSSGSAGSTASGGAGGAGGSGLANSLTGTSVIYGAGGAGGKGNTNWSGSPGAVNTGNGGGGGGFGGGGNIGGRDGGSGIIVIVY
jgi:hypothetical protein